MPSTTRTLGPLHLEDLEPHRFEDMVRQLLYDFRTWRQLEATGRSGSDEGFDARGWEVVRGELEGDTEEPGTEDEEELLRPEHYEDRLWLIQCKREKSIGPKKLIKYLNDIPEAERQQLYGIILAAACNFSKKARDNFRTKVREIGVAEAFLWGKGEIEDMLFQPKNDHLLFAYFGISLQARQRTLKTKVRARLAMKRKALKHLAQYFLVLLRDASDDRYPWLDEDTSKDRNDRGRRKVMTYDDCRSDGVHLQLRRHVAFLDDDGESWDFAERWNDAKSNSFKDPWREEKGTDINDRAEVMAVWEALPGKNRAWFEVYVVLPYENILDIDEHGDEWFQKPHIYTTPFHPIDGPFRPYSRSSLEVPRTFGGRHAFADEAKRIRKFPRQARNAKKIKRS